MNQIRVIELFAGIGAQHQALKNLGIPCDVVGISEIDKSAITGYNAIHGETLNLGDITQIEHLPDCDLVTYSFPCQDLSIAGKREGMKEGSNTRSSLLWEVGRLLQEMKDRDKLPEVLMMENVDAILNRKNVGHFHKWITTLNEMGYSSSYTVMNAKNYGIPQNRKRCFMVSTLTMGELKFPQGEPLKLRLKDMLEEKVPDTYFLSKERIAKFEEQKIRQKIKGTGFGWKPLNVDKEEVINTISDQPCRNATGNWVEIPEIEVLGNLNEMGRLEQHNRVYSKDGICPTISTPHGGDKSPKIKLEGYCGNQHQHTAVYNTDGLCPTIASCDWKDPAKIKENLKIRYLTPRECLRLMGFDDLSIDKLIDAVPSKTSQYKLAGNSIVVNCLEYIFKAIYIDKTFRKPRPKQISLLKVGGIE